MKCESHIIFRLLFTFIFVFHRALYVQEYVGQRRHLLFLLTFSLSGVASSTALRGAGVAIDPGEDERGEDTPEDAGPHGRSVGGRLRSRETRREGHE